MPIARLAYTIHGKITSAERNIRRKPTLTERYIVVQYEGLHRTVAGSTIDIRAEYF
jgi:hypothetical protein